MAERLLLDTHALLWWCSEAESLSATARDAISDGNNLIYVSAVSAMEIATKFRIGKLPESQALAENFVAEIDREGFVELPLSAAHAQRGGSLAIAHKDPFDRLLIAQAQIEDLKLVSNEVLFDGYAVLRCW